jgi:cobalt-zinc-cadmium efflux system membrane fusion protein
MVVQRGADPLVEIGDASALRIVADVFERDLSRVHPGARSIVTLGSVDRRVEGRVASIGTVVAAGLRTVPVYLIIDAHDTPMRPGMFGRVAIDSADGGITLPADAVLIKEGKGPVVFVQEDPLTFVQRSVEVARTVAGRVQILSGVSVGEKVVVHGALLLDGAADQLL